jgi:hypothetical protein
MKSKSTNADSKEVSVAEPIGGVKVNAKKALSQIPEVLRRKRALAKKVK